MILILQILWAVGCFAWNAYGLYLISQEQPPIGPTASAIGAVLCVVFALLFWWLHSRYQKWPYFIVSVVAGLMAAFTIYGAFTKDPSLWPSEGWRWAGIILNGIGTVAAIAAIAQALNWTTKKENY